MGVCKVKRKYWVRMLVLIILAVAIFFTYDNKKSIISNAYTDHFIFRIMKTESSNIQRVYKVTSEQSVKIAQIVSVSGYKSIIELLVIIDVSKNTVEDVQVIAQHETHDYGAAITEDWFLERLVKKDVRVPLRIVKMRQESPNDVVAVTGATVSSAAVVYGVNLCMDNYVTMMK